MPKISIVVPLFNEQENIAKLVSSIQVSLDNFIDPNEWELILVDDGSFDNTWAQICIQSERHPRQIQGLKLSRNFGHQHALLAGLNIADGQAIISMDGDLQHPPEVLPKLIKKWEDGNKIIYTRRIQQESLSWFKRKTSAWFYRFFSWLSGVSIEPGSSDFRLIDRQVLTELLKFNDVNPFIRGAVKWLGFDSKAVTIEFPVADRFAGESQYTLRKMINFANGAIISFSTKPLIIGIWIGLITGSFAFIELVYIIVQASIGITVPGWASTVGITALLFGVLFVLLGVIGLYLARIHTALQTRPKFVVEEHYDGQKG
jgi:dolichol-phosphate mannosyltransferase